MRAALKKYRNRSLALLGLILATLTSLEAAQIGGRVSNPYIDPAHTHESLRADGADATKVEVFDDGVAASNLSGIAVRGDTGANNPGLRFMTDAGVEQSLITHFSNGGLDHLFIDYRTASGNIILRTIDAGSGSTGTVATFTDEEVTLQGDFRIVAESGADTVLAITDTGAITGLAWQRATKAADESVSLSTTLQNDDELSLSVELGQRYSLTGEIWVTSPSTTPDLTADFNLSSGTLVSDLIVYQRLGVNETISRFTALGSNMNMNVDSGANLLKVSATFATSGSGTVTLNYRWAQQTSSATATTVKRGSWLELKAI